MSCPLCNALLHYDTSYQQFAPPSDNIAFGYEWAAPADTTSGGSVWYTTYDPQTFHPSSTLCSGQDLSQQDYNHWQDSFDTMPPHHALSMLMHEPPALTPAATLRFPVSSLAHALEPQDPHHSHSSRLATPAPTQDPVSPETRPAERANTPAQNLSVATPIHTQTLVPPFPGVTTPDYDTLPRLHKVSP